MHRPTDSLSLEDRIAGIRYWYHTMELAPGVVTPGYFDLRGVVGRLPWPDLRGRRCLDVATFDGFYAFEMERRGAAEVVAIDLDDGADLDWLPREVRAGFARGDEVIGDGFRLAHEVYGSSVRRVSASVYDLSSLGLGEFDFVVCGALLQHLRDPMGALLQMREVCAGQLLSIERVHVRTSLLSWRTPALSLVGHDRTWMLPNVRGHRRMLEQCGFDVVDSEVVPMPRRAGVEPGLRAARLRTSWRLLGGAPHPPFSVARARPASGLHPLPDRP